MKCIYQLLNCETGERSPIMSEDRKDFANRLRKFDLPEAHAVIVIMQKPDENQDWTFSNAPIMQIETFVNLFAEQQPEQQKEMPL